MVQTNMYTAQGGITRCVVLGGHQEHLSEVNHIAEAPHNLVSGGAVEPCADLIHEKCLTWAHHNLTYNEGHSH